MKLLIGLGNPGKEYDGTRHNVGFAFADYVQDQAVDIMVEKSDEVMNRSGDPVKKLLHRHKISPAHLIIVHDDLDITFGRFKLSFGRNSAGHRGIESIMTVLKTKEFWRLRIGVGSTKLAEARRQGTVADFVLSRFVPSERSELSEIFGRALAALLHAK